MPNHDDKYPARLGLEHSIQNRTECVIGAGRYLRDPRYQPHREQNSRPQTNIAFHKIGGELQE